MNAPRGWGGTGAVPPHFTDEELVLREVNCLAPGCTVRGDLGFYLPEPSPPPLAYGRKLGPISRGHSDDRTS